MTEAAAPEHKHQSDHQFEISHGADRYYLPAVLIAISVVALGIANIILIRTLTGDWTASSVPIGTESMNGLFSTINPTLLVVGTGAVAGLVLWCATVLNYYKNRLRLAHLELEFQELRLRSEFREKLLCRNTEQ